MWIIEETGQVIKHPKSIQIGEAIHPADIFYRWSNEQLFSIGIRPLVDTMYDRERYWPVGHTDTLEDGVVKRTYELSEREDYLPRVKADKYDRIKGMIDSILGNGFVATVDGFEYHMDAFEEHVSRLKAGIDLIQMNGLSEMDIVDFNNRVIRQVPVATVLEICKQTANNYYAMWALKNEKRAEINACETPEAVEAVTI